MKQLLYRLLFGCMTLLLLAACEADNAPFENNADGSNCVILNLEASSVPIRATVAGNDKENAVDHIDVFVFKTDTDNTLFHYERLQLTAANAGKAALTKKRSEFGPNENYKVYIVANSTITDFATVKSLDDLKGKIQEDKAIHLTGLDNLQNVPQYFLMDGIAKASSTSADNTVILNDGMLANNTELKVDLKRAAAKIIVHMKKGSQVQFSTKPGQDGALYYMRNLPYSSTVLSGVGNDAKLRTSQPISTKYFDWKTEEITVTAYAYEHKWENVSTLEKEPRLIVNIPLTYTPEDPQSKAETLKNSYYQIPVSRDQLLERNTCYETTVTINAPGGSDPSEPLKLEPINYTVNEWIGKPINIGGETDNLAYLTLNKYDMEMHNLTDDNTTLEFASSSNVKAKITKVWYIDKFGQEKTLSQVRTNPNQWSESNGKNLCEITITPDENITGNIHVHGRVPENNTIRYITFELTNEEKITRTVTVAQYPLEYITNIQGWYSYRMDFEGTNYEKGENSHYTCATSYTKSTDKWSFSTYDYNSFFGSKVAYVQRNGTSSLNYYYYYRRWPGSWNKIETSENLSSLNNARMYHVRITATSGEYTLGRPRMIDGKTDGGKDNEVLVSPSFMIASQLGAVNSNACKSVEMAASHCKQYVETYKDKEGKVHHVKGWRLPTKAEVAIIMKFQKKEDAIDVVLSGNQYWCASGCVKTSTGEIISSTGSPVRCIRDAYDIEK